jgi:hypothetical protein
VRRVDWVAPHEEALVLCARYRLRCYCRERAVLPRTEFHIAQYYLCCGDGQRMRISRAAHRKKAQASKPGLGGLCYMTTMLRTGALPNYAFERAESASPRHAASDLVHCAPAARIMRRRAAAQRER